MASPAPAFRISLSDIRMTITLYKHMSTRLSKVRAPTPGRTARTGWRSASRTNLEGSHPIVFRVVFDLGEMQGLQHGRDVHPESPAKTLLQSIPPTDGILRGSTPRFNGPVRGRLLVVGVPEGHPVAGRLEHLVKVVDASEVVPKLRAPRLDDERGRIKSLVAERLKFRCPARRLQLPRMFARALTGLAFSRHSEIPRLIRVRCPRLPLAGMRIATTEEPPDRYFNDSPASGDGNHGRTYSFGRSLPSPRVSENWAPWTRISLIAISESPGLRSTPRIASRSTRTVRPRRRPSSVVARTQYSVANPQMNS